MGIVFLSYDKRLLIVYDIEEKLVPLHDSDEICDISSIDAETYRCAFDDGRYIGHSRSLAGLTRRDDDIVLVGLYLDEVVDVSGQDSDLPDSFFTEILIY